MNTMTDTETYNGWKNRETWAFNLHWQNDQGLYNETLEEARRVLEFNSPDELSDRELGSLIVGYWRDGITEYQAAGGKLYDALAMMRDEVGSWWRVDSTETGAAIREALSNEEGE